MGGHATFRREVWHRCLRGGQNEDACIAARARRKMRKDISSSGSMLVAIAFVAAAAFGICSSNSAHAEQPLPHLSRVSLSLHLSARVSQEKATCIYLHICLSFCLSARASDRQTNTVHRHPHSRRPLLLFCFLLAPVRGNLV